jgi:hypothetical protein
LNVIARRLWPQLPSHVGSRAAFAMHCICNPYWKPDMDYVARF